MFGVVGKLKFGLRPFVYELKVVLLEGPAEE
jgi:hypothetical protein